MAVGVAAVMRQIRNYFEKEWRDGAFAVSGGMLSPAPNAPYVCIKGSASCDGVWRMAGGALMADHGEAPGNEEFTGRVWALHPPNDFLALCEQIAEYDAKNPVGAMQSESFGDYSYTRAVGQGGAQGWAYAFSAQLAPYRKMMTEVEG